MMDFYFCRGGDLLVFGPKGNCIQSPYGNIFRAMANFYQQQKTRRSFASYDDALKFCLGHEYLEAGLKESLRETYCGQIAYYLRDVIPKIMATGDCVEDYSRHGQQWKIPANYDDSLGLGNFDRGVNNTLELLNYVSSLTEGDTKYFGLDVQEDDYDSDLIWSENNFLDEFRNLDDENKLRLLGYAYSKRSMESEA